MDFAELVIRVLGKPYATRPSPPSSFDCCTLVEYARRHVYDLPSPGIAISSRDTPADIDADLVAFGSGAWAEVSEPQAGDIISTHSALAGTPTLLHVAMWHPSGALQAVCDEHMRGSVQLVDLWKLAGVMPRGIGYWRLAE